MFKRNQITRKAKSLDEKIEGKDYLGLTVICVDGCFRKVYNVASPLIQDKSQFWKKGLLVINEGDPLSVTGHWVTILALECALKGNKQPDKEQQQAFIRVASGITTLNLKSILQGQKQGTLPLDFSD